MATTAVKPTAASSPPPKRLMFDRRYGWVLDEWKEPSEEALAGGRGMFCVLPLAKALFKRASETINVVGSSTLDVLEKPELLSPKIVQAALTDQMHKFVSTVKNAEPVVMTTGRNSKRESTSGTSDLPAAA